MSKINEEGILVDVDSKVIVRRFLNIEHGALNAIHGIVVHQTDSLSVEAAFSSYRAGGNGAHFLISREGIVYQTASVNKRCFHIGRVIKSKCLEINRATCQDKELAKAMTLGWRARIIAVDKIERQKNYPSRFPVNSDSIGIELVGQHIDDKHYESVTPLQNVSLQWLIDQLYAHFSLSKNDVYRHPDVSYKNPDEAGSAKWK